MGEIGREGQTGRVGGTGRVGHGWGPASRSRKRLPLERGGGADRGDAAAPSEGERGWGPASIDE